jgi:UDP-2-acetamido-2,6-beta-L-arabino-hexul-4-ose reductase
MKVLVTGASGFVGRNLCVELARREDVELLRYDVESSPEELDRGLATADIIFHLAGVNRPQNVEEFQTGNAGLTGEICRKLIALGRKAKLVLSSSIQAELENPYGQSKRGAEEAVRQYCQQTGAVGLVHRLKNLFGKWCRPNYNSVTATFCHNIAHDLPIQVSNPANVVELTYIDDVVAAFVDEMDAVGKEQGGYRLADPLPSHKISLGELADLIKSFREQRKTLRLPDLSSRFVQALYATYLSYLEEGDFGYTLDIKRDDRGSLAEFLKSPAFGQIFISRTKPGITRGNHYHHTKTEKFMVVQGDAMIRFRQIAGEKIIEYRVRGEEYRVIDIPPGYTHHIENIGPGEMVTLFWASEIFDPNRPDTVFLKV